jgi:hypothetical protein
MNMRKYTTSVVQKYSALLFFKLNDIKFDQIPRKLNQHIHHSTNILKIIIKYNFIIFIWCCRWSYIFLYTWSYFRFEFWKKCTIFWQRGVLQNKKNKKLRCLVHRIRKQNNSNKHSQIKINRHEKWFLFTWLIWFTWLEAMKELKKYFLARWIIHIVKTRKWVINVILVCHKKKTSFF